MKRKLEITFETEETVVIRRAPPTLTVFCRECRATVEMVPPQAVAAFSPLSEREIFRLIEAGQIHFVEAERVFICRDSLAKRIAPTTKEKQITGD
jgi:hypothetical protein